MEQSPRPNNPSEQSKRKEKERDAYETLERFALEDQDARKSELIPLARRIEAYQREGRDWKNDRELRRKVAEELNKALEQRAKRARSLNDVRGFVLYEKQRREIAKELEEDAADDERWLYNERKCCFFTYFSL